MEKNFAYGKYTKMRDAAWQFLLDQHVDALPVPMSPPTRQLDIRLCGYTANTGLIRSSGLGSLLDADGFAYLDPNGKLGIFYNDKRSRQESRFTIAHELGHILMGHIGPVPGVLSSDDPKKEKEADRFALRILAPVCVLWARGIYTAEEIAKVCDIPPGAARKRAGRIAALRKRDMWLTNPLEQELFAQFGLSDPREKSGQGE